MCEDWRTEGGGTAGEGAPINPKGIETSSPRLRGRSDLGKRPNGNHNPNGVVANVTRDGENCMVATALRLGMSGGRGPRVARVSQPWALGRNPVGILEWRKGRHQAIALFRRFEVEIPYDWRKHLVHRFEALTQPIEMLRPKLLIRKVSVLSRVEPTRRLVFGIVPCQ